MTQKEKILKLSDAYKAIDNARDILRKLEVLADQSASGESIDLVKVVECTHGLRKEVDRILIGFVESQMQPDSTQNKER